jgi:fatty-acyl-CoA synthase
VPAAPVPAPDPRAELGPADLVLHALRGTGHRPAIHLDGTVITVGQLRDEVSRYTQAYAQLGLAAGSPVAVLSANRPEVVIAGQANQISAVRSLALHPYGSLDDHAYVLEDAGVETLLFDPTGFSERAGELLERVPGLQRALAFGPTDVGEDLTARAARFTPGPLHAPTVEADGISGLAYTGGTTGQPKGVMGTYRGAARMTMIQLAEWDIPAAPRFLICTPLSHAGAAFLTPTLLRGGSLVVLPGFDPERYLDAVERYRITATMLVPTMIYALLDHPKLATTDLSSLEVVYYGASAISPARLQEAIARLGPIFFQFYGQAECPMAITALRREEHDPGDLARLASCGRPAPWTRVALLDDGFEPVEPGTPGEICVRGPLVMKGYWNKPEETAAALAGGWLHTGDVAVSDDEGFLTIVDRKKDMIVTGGFNVFPREVEDVIGTHPAVAQVAVIGVPDERWGEAVKAVVVLRDGAAASPEEITALVRDRKGPVYAPKSVDFAEQIPVTGLGKPDKKALRQTYWGSSTRMVN